MHSVNSLYLHFPHCRHLCNYCDFFKSVPKTLGEYGEYEIYLKNAINLHSEFLKRNDYLPGLVETLYMGGGTPSLWGAKGVASFKEQLESSGYQLFAPNYEWTMEINPGSFVESDLDRYFELGVNRASIGTQSTNPQFIKLLDRVHSKDEAFTLMEKMALGNRNFSVDLMLGLPYSQKFKRDIERELEELLSFNPTHLSLYILTVKGNYVHRDHLPDDDWTANEFLLVSELLRSRGFLHYEVSNFAKPGFESRHNLRYWDQETVAALGPSATGYLSEKRLRYKWPGMNLRIEEEQLSQESAELEHIYLKLRTNKGLARSEVGSGQKFDEMVNKLENKGWIEPGGVLRATPQGYLMMDSIMDEIFKATN